ncbi:basic helix-loop-helix (bHLH) DNA-bindingsuperfamily protein [Striga asiatica]|uniref:Basic helix-loop-helix (BHLH) DNA-bindingsuperfamily protein n=1 Tax=Striga asiatica TaxID=4170 RepID=A0A5A7QJH3_STRAF|nr:basic helix-loop-helix (bHLH) DNA-bindingsuperfamily protein [Striga asiatica]
MFGSSEISSNNGFAFSNPTNKNTLIKNSIPTGGGDFTKGREIDGPDFFQVHGLSRYRSAPSSFLAALMDPNPDNNSSSGDESEAFLSALIDGQHDLNQKHQHQAQYSTKQEIGDETETRPGFFPNGHAGGYVGSYSVGMENQVHVSLADNGNSSNLVRQSSSPAGFFNGFGVMGEVGNYRVQNHANASSSAAGFSNHLNFSAGQCSGSRFMPTIPENLNESISTCSPENDRSKNSINSWNVPPLKRNRDSEPKMYSNFNLLENQNGESRKMPSGLVSHMSLPKTSSEMATVENYLHFQQESTVVPCQIRAKRGCATHPRSIAERMRRTRISDNMKKLQDLFPSMDKQINTADMLDLAVEYIKDLQKQVQALTDTKTKCVCSNNPWQTSPTT